MNLKLLFALGLPLSSLALCPYLDGLKREQRHAQIPMDHPPIVSLSEQQKHRYYKALQELDLEAVKADIRMLLTDSQDFWPADYENYGPFFVRLAWHCSGSYRTYDGRGGCDGARQRFDPERSWDDNTNLDKARKLLEPIKLKYGVGLSWGDLIVLAGTTAIESMGGPTIGFCAGRVDDTDGQASLMLGPTAEQEALYPCEVNGQCTTPLGTTTIGLIYVNPEGPMNEPAPETSAMEVRDTFGRMAMNDSETVALIGGGHSFGKTHGACPAGVGPSPKDDPYNPWAGLCGTGKGADAYTSGFEGPWTTTPLEWNTEFFDNLLKYDWEVAKGPGDKWQWVIQNSSRYSTPVAPGPQGGEEALMMLTTDISLMYDPTGIYQEYVREYAVDSDSWDNAFAHAWYKLTTRDMGPVTRCFGDLVPPAQDWQNPLPDPPADLADFSQVKSDISDVLSTPNPSVMMPDVYDGVASYAPAFVRLAWQCASTFRQTDYLGGCNGARIRYSPEKDWPINAALNQALDLLDPIKEKYGDGLSWADLIVLAGSTALEETGAPPIPFCGGRTDATGTSSSSAYLAPKVTGDANDSIGMLKEAVAVMGLSLQEFVALSGGHSLGKMHVNRTGYFGAWTSNPLALSNEYFQVLLTEAWEEFVVPETGMLQYKASGKDLYMLQSDLSIRYDSEMLAIAQEYASDNNAFLVAFSKAWVKMMNADRFDGPVKNTCL